MLEKMRKKLFSCKIECFPSWYSVSAWIGWWWSRCLLWMYFSSCVADIIEQHGPAGSFRPQCDVQKSASLPSHQGTQRPALHLVYQLPLLLVPSPADGAQSMSWCLCDCLCVCMWVVQGTEELGTHMFTHVHLSSLGQLPPLHQSSISLAKTGVSSP